MLVPFLIFNGLLTLWLFTIWNRKDFFNASLKLVFLVVALSSFWFVLQLSGYVLKIS